MMGRGRKEGLGLGGCKEIDYNLFIEALKTSDLGLLKRNLARREEKIIEKVFGSNMTGADYQERRLGLPDGRKVVLSLYKSEEIGNVEEIIKEADLKYRLEIGVEPEGEGTSYDFGSRLLIGRDLFFFWVKAPAAVGVYERIIGSEEFGSLAWREEREVCKEYGRVLEEIWKVVRRE
jgi:hypothetical protein